MRKLSVVGSLVLLSTVFLPHQALANPQHERMKQCNQDAREKALKGEERKKFMSTCLSGKHNTAAAKPDAAKPAAAPKTEAAKTPAAAKPATVAATPAPAATDAAARERMKTCNQNATDKALKGDERKAFVAACLKG